MITRLPGPNPTQRLLTLDPTARGFAFALLEGGDLLVDWGTVQMRGELVPARLARVEALLRQYEPDFVVLEDCDGPGSRRSPAAQAFIDDVARIAKRRGLPVRAVSRSRVRRAFSTTGSTKFAIATAIAERFPELRPRLPRFRRPWMSEDERMSIFDALSFALTLLREREKRRSRSERMEEAA